MTVEEQLQEALVRIGLLEKQNAELREQLAKWRKEIQEWRRGYRTRGKRFSSRAEGKRGAKTKPLPRTRRPRTGASNRPIPARVDATETYPMPTTCGCGQPLQPTGETYRTLVEDLPPVRPVHTAHVAHVGFCTRCQKKVAARVPGSNAEGVPCAQTQLGPRAVALGLELRFAQHVPFRRVQQLFSRWWGLEVSAMSLSRQSQRWAQRTAEAKEEIRQRILASPVVGGDETSLRQQGRLGWVWLLRTAEASLFAVDPSRGAEVFDRLLPVGRFVGVFVSDFYNVYTRRTDLLHSYCGAHLVRKAKEIAAVEGDPLAAQFAASLSWMYGRGTEAAARGELDKVEEIRTGFRRLCENERFSHNDALVALQDRIALRFEGVVAFLGRSDIPFHNNGSERDIRPVAVHRKITGGCRSAGGSAALGHWMSVTQTLKKQNRCLADWIGTAMTGYRQGLPAPTVFSAPLPS